MKSRNLVYQFGFRLACLIVMLIALSIVAMTYFFATREPESIKEISQWYLKIVMALVGLLGSFVIRTLTTLSKGQSKTSVTRRIVSLSHQSRSQLREQLSGAIVSKVTGGRRLKGKDTGGRLRRRRDLQNK
jgi:hypothetical protein